MPTPTERFALDTYDPGESWDHTDTVQFLDEIAVERDVVANRPTSGTYDGEIFFATDEEIFYQWDATGTQWNEVLNAPTQAEFDSHSTQHESGGADEIPLNNLDLPAGAQIDEDGGDLVIRDSGGSIVLRRDEGAGTWDFVSGDLVNIESLEAVDSQTKEGPVANVLAYGAVMDGATDDSQALRDAFTAVGPTGTVYIPSHKGSLYIGSKVQFDLAGEDGFSLIAEGPIKPAGGITGLQIINGYPNKVELRVEGGGSTLADTALEFRGVVGGRVDVRADDYAGTVVRDVTQNAGEPKTKNRQYETIYTDNCGRPYRADNIHGGIQFDMVWTEVPTEGLSIQDSNDLSITHLETFYNSGTDKGFELNGCSAIHIGTLALGGPTTADLANLSGSTNNPSPERLRIDRYYGISGDGNSLVVEDYSEVNIKAMAGGNTGDNITLRNCSKLDAELVSRGSANGLVIDGLEQSDVSLKSEFDTVGVLFSGSETKRTDVHARVMSADEHGISDGGNDLVGSFCEISGHLQSCGQSTGTWYELYLPSITKPVTLNGLRIESGTSDGLTNFGSSTPVWTGGKVVETGQGVFDGSRPGTIKDVHGLTTFNRGTDSIGSGSTSVTVSHGLDVPPSADNIQVTPNASLGAASDFWVDTVTSSQFNINLDADPTQTVGFAWIADIEIQ